MEINVSKKDLKECKALQYIKTSGEKKLYDYLSGNAPSSSYTNENVKNIITINGSLDWNKVEDKTNALFSIGYSEQGNIIGILTNANALLQDMLIYCPLEEAKQNLKEVLQVNVGSEPILGKRYAVNGQSPLCFSLPVITRGGYKTFAVVIHNKHASKFIDILKTIDIDALTKEDMEIITKDISFISRTQELAIDVAKDKTIQIVDTSKWLKKGVKPKNYWLSNQRNEQGWFATDNLSEILEAKKFNKAFPKFQIKKMDEEKITLKVNKEVTTSGSMAREILKKATEDYFNDVYKEMLTYSQEINLNIEAKSLAKKNKDLAHAIKPILMAYKNYMIDNIPKEVDEQDKTTVMLLRKIIRDKMDRFASVCRNTIYHLGNIGGYSFKETAMTCYGVDLLEVSKDEGKYFKAIMEEEFKLLYSNTNTIIEKEKLFYVDELTQDDILDDKEIIVNFVNGQAYNEDEILIAKTSYKFNANNCKIVFEESTGNFYAQQEVDFKLPIIGKDILVRIENIDNEFINDFESVKFVPKSPNNTNLIFGVNEYSEEILLGNLGYKGILDNLTRLTILNNNNIYNEYNKGDIQKVEQILNDFNNNLSNEFKIVDIITTNKDSEQYRANYLIINL